MRPSLLIAISLAAALLPAQERKAATARTPEGTVQILYTPATLRGRGLSDLEKNQVWRMSAGPAAELVTEIPLRHERVILAPGRYRISAKYLGKEKFRLLFFRGPRIFQEGTPYQEIPLTLGEEKKEREELAFRVWAGEDDGVRGKLHWGTQSLNFSMQPLQLQRFRMQVAGKPATLRVFRLPKVELLQKNLQNRLRLHFATLRQDGPDGIEYRLHGVNSTRGFHVLIRNATLDDTRLELEAEKELKQRFLKMAEQTTGQADTWKKRIDAVEGGIVMLEKRLEKADAHVRKLVLPCRVRGGRSTDFVTASRVGPKPKSDDKLAKVLTVRISYGARSIELRLDGAKFNAEED